MRVTVMRSGGVGWLTKACVSDLACKVVFVDKDKIQALQDGEMPMLKSGLKARRACNQSGGHIPFSTDASEAIDLGDILFNVNGRNLYKPGAQHEWGIACQRLDRCKDLVLSYRPVLDENTAAMTPVSMASLHA